MRAPVPEAAVAALSLSRGEPGPDGPSHELDFGMRALRRLMGTILVLVVLVAAYYGSYLLYRPLYIVTNRTNTHIKEVDKFLAFAHSREGREIIRKNGVVPYLEALWLTRKQRKQWIDSRKLEQRRSGS